MRAIKNNWREISREIKMRLCKCNSGRIEYLQKEFKIVVKKIEEITKLSSCRNAQQYNDYIESYKKIIEVKRCTIMKYVGIYF